MNKQAEKYFKTMQRTQENLLIIINTFRKMRFWTS